MTADWLDAGATMLGGVLMIGWLAAAFARLLLWTDPQEFRRTSPTLLAMASALSLTDAQLDQLFITAAGIEA